MAHTPSTNGSGELWPYYQTNTTGNVQTTANGLINCNNFSSNPAAAAAYASNYHDTCWNRTAAEIYSNQHYYAAAKTPAQHHHHHHPSFGGQYFNEALPFDASFFAPNDPSAGQRLNTNGTVKQCIKGAHVKEEPQLSKSSIFFNIF